MRPTRIALPLLLLAACGRHPAPAPSEAHYLIGAPYEMGGVWRYPAESFRYDATGLAVRLPDRTGPTADGEVFDQSAIAAAHPTLQLPAIARVTNLENGRQIRVRIDDRGPTDPGRLLGLTRRAADLLGLPPAGATQIRLEVDPEPSQALRDQLHAGPAGVTAAPRGQVTAVDLPPPGARAHPARPESPVPSAITASATPIPDRLPETMIQGAPHPGQLWLLAGQFTAPRYANLVKSRLAPLPVEIRHQPGAGALAYRVLVGPFATVAEADAALDQARGDGVTDAAIVVE